MVKIEPKLAKTSMDGQDVQEEKPSNVSNDETKRWRGGRSTQTRMDERINFAYSLLLEGNTRRSNAELVASRFGISSRTAHDDITKAMVLLRDERTEDRAQMLNIITASRLAVLKKAIRKGNYQVACHLLDSLGRSHGELEATVQALSVPNLNITVEAKIP